MCVCPVHIANPAYKPHDIYTPPFIDVPCGHCWQCKLTRQNDFAFRVLSDLLSYKCIPFFVTLTYNDDYLPVLTFNKYLDKGCESFTTVPFRDTMSLSVWNKQHVQRFNKILRRQIHYYYGIDSCAFSYLCCCERGSNDIYIDDRGRERVATSRPHYHLLYLLRVPEIPLPIRKLPLDFINYCRFKQFDLSFVSFFKFLLSDRWIYGNVDDVSYCRDVVSATKYITKYITKDLSESLFYIDKSSIVGLKDRYYNDCLKKCELDYYFGSCNKLCNPVKFSDILPRSFSSINLGMSFVENKSYDELLDFCSGLKKVCLPSQNNSSMIMLPLYYIRKLTRQILRKRPYSYSQRYEYNGSGFVFKCKKNTSQRKPRECWDNQNGFYLDYVSPSYSETIVSNFGRQVMRKRLINSYRRFKSGLGNYFTNRSFFNIAINSFSSLVPTNYLLSFKDIGISSSILNLGFGDFVFNYHALVKHSDFLDVQNFSKLCSTAVMTLKHVAFEKSYSNRLCSTVSDNSELFLNHYL